MKDITIVIEDKLGSVITLQSVGDNKLEIVKSDSNENLIFISSDEFKVTQYRNGFVPLTPIELPSDEEILIPFPTEEDKNFRDGKEIKNWMNGWEKGYKEALQAIRNKIKGGNNEQQ